jgi:hypothetical protein
MGHNLAQLKLLFAKPWNTLITKGILVEHLEKFLEVHPLSVKG